MSDLDPSVPQVPSSVPSPQQVPPGTRETGGRAGPEPTRYGDWEKNGRCIDF
ncbi:MAG: DUF1674 domain-containing protein [Xanthomonadales bacterium]|nr:DUF1674 domain-containing protein [Xanthomonadales bacterium]